MQIAVYSGSFDPLHIGHLAVLAYLNGRFDKVLLVVSPQNPFKGAEKAANATARLSAAREAVERHPELARVEVCDIEFQMSAPQYTFRTLEALQALYPSDTLTLVIGGDNLSAFNRWRNYAQILLQFGVLVYPREGFDSEAVKATLLKENELYRIDIARMPLVSVSSTEIREAETHGDDVKKWLM